MQHILARTLLLLGVGILISVAYADGDDAMPDMNSDIYFPANNTYLSPQSYLQNPYIAMPSGGGTQTVRANQLAQQTIWQQWFTDGTWNVMGEASYISQNGGNNYGYATNLFGQTGSVAGVSFGGLLTITNPFFANNLSPQNLEQKAQTLPVTQQIMPQELFAEYRYRNIIQIDAGWIGISNSPWLTYYQNNVLNLVTYQGAIINAYPGGGWLLTTFGINASQLTSEEGFGQQTLYNPKYNIFSNTPNVGNSGSPGTLGLGANWTNTANTVNLRFWGYQFYNYANLAYADSTLKFPINNNLNVTLGAQALTEDANGDDVLNEAGYGAVNSNAVGMQLGVNYKIVGLELGYDGIFGPRSAYGGGAIVSPYTYQYASDPLYTTGFFQGMVEQTAGNAIKVTPSLNLFDHNLTISPAYMYFDTTAQPASSEYDITANYAIPQVKGLNIFAGYGYVLQPWDHEGNNYQVQVLVSYLY